MRKTYTKVLVSWLFTIGIVLSCEQSDKYSMKLGSDSIHTKDQMCLMIGARAVAGDFFKDLRSRNSNNGVTFSKHRQKVRVFPERLTVKVDAGFDRCVGRGPVDCDRCDFQLSSEFMNSLQFEAYWKNGFAMQKADIEVLNVEQSNDLARIAPFAKLWKYELSVRSENIPLSDTLVVILLSSDGRVLSRLSGKL